MSATPGSRPRRRAGRTAVGIVFARSENRVIGRDGALPWSLPDEYAHFEAVTAGGVVIMGRRSWQEHGEPLAGRTNVVLSHRYLRSGAPPPGAHIYGSLSLALQRIGGGPDAPSRVWVIGGGALIAAALPFADRVWETVVHAELTGDATVPALPLDGFDHEQHHVHGADDRHAHAFTVWRHDRRVGAARVVPPRLRRDAGSGSWDRSALR